MKTILKFIKANLVFFAGCLLGSFISSVIFGIYMSAVLDNEQINKIQVISDCLLE